MAEQQEQALPEVKSEELDDEAADRAFEEDDAATQDRMAEAMADAATEPPDWAAVPPNLAMPEEGSQIAFVRIPAKWTRRPAGGDRTCILWPIGETEERLAYARSRGDIVRSISELSKSAIRAVDGHKANWDGNLKKPGSVTEFWSAIGPKGRSMIRNWYVKTHNVTDEEALDFFSQHFVTVTVRKG
jgi:hypothetical protein